MSDEIEETAGSTPDEAPAVEPETSSAADSSQGASPEAGPTSADAPVAEESASADAEVDEERASEDVAEEPAADASEDVGDAEDEPAAEVSEDVEEPTAEEPADEKPAKAGRPKRADRAASTPRRQRERRGRQPGEPLPVVRAQAKYVRSSARKARLVCDHIRGKSVVEARAILAVTPRAIARDWSKLLESAVANAEHNHELVGEDLFVKAVHADEGPTIKRFRPRAMGRATPIRKRTSHLTILLTPKD
jgi:ribosomal protein L22